MGGGMGATVSGELTSGMIAQRVLEAWERDAMHGVDWFVTDNDQSHAEIAVEAVLEAISAAGWLAPDDPERVGVFELMGLISPGFPEVFRDR